MLLNVILNIKESQKNVILFIPVFYCISSNIYLKFYCIFILYNRISL